MITERGSQIPRLGEGMQLPHPGPGRDTSVLSCWESHSIFHHPPIFKEIKVRSGC